jgi:tetratricopeptide (TPR) repeat protein
MQRRVVVGLWVGCVVLAAVPVLGGVTEDGAKAFQEGNALLAEGDFNGALQAFKTAAKTDASNQEYRQTHAMLRQVIRLRAKIEKEQDSEQWVSTAQALRTFYHTHKLYSESLPLDRKMHSQRPTAGSAVMLAETLLALGEHSEAAEVLGSLGDKGATPRTNVLLGLALARQGRIDAAKAFAGRATPKDEAGPSFFFDLARLRALTGEPRKMADALTRSCELTLPSRLDAFKAEARACKDFVALASTADFTEALKTQSKVKESKCSKGSACGKCPRRAKCASQPTKGKRTKP